jgi:adenylate cyclase
MASEGFKRKLTAILSADVAGYSRLMSEDEAATVKTLATYREVMASLITQHRGRVVDSPGDNVLAEFASVVDAVQCAVAVQKELQARNAELPENRRMEFRVGINLGDVIEEEDRIYGDGVNIAARLEALADPGGICVSKTAFDHIETKLPLGYEYLGEQPVKNIPKPVGAYRVLMEPRVTVAGKIEKEKAVPVWRRKAILAGCVALALVVIPALIWNFYFRPPPLEVASMEKMAYPLPDKPSIAVLPFVNMSEDTKQEYFSDGLSDQIITALSKVPNLFVIARNSTFTYKGRPVKVQKVAEDLGVRYVLEGSVQKTADRIRITAQLIDATTGHHLWAERYDRPLEDIFAIQDEITFEILAALQMKLTVGEKARLIGKGTDNLEAYEKCLQAAEHYQRFSKEGNIQTRKLCEDAIALDPGYPAAYRLLGWAHLADARYGWSKSRTESFKGAVEFAQKTLELDDTQAAAHALLSMVYLYQRQFERAISEGERAISISPNTAHFSAILATILNSAGRPEEAIELIKKAIRLSPIYPGWFLGQLGMAYRLTGRHDDAIEALKQFRERSPEHISSSTELAIVYSQLGRMDEARALAEEILKKNPKFSLKAYAKSRAYKDPAELDRELDALRKAGLTDEPPLPLPDKPSIAVLPFVNMSDDKSQEYFSDGLTEEIITALSKSQRLFVIARESSFSYKGRPIKVQMVGRELGVKYVLEGSVRMAVDQVRITAQLIDATTGRHLWAETYDRELKDLFALQDEITKNIMASLQVKLTDGEQARLYAKGTGNLQAFLKCLQGREYMYRFSREGIDLARPLLKEAIALDENYAAPYRWLGGSHMLDVILGDSKDPKESIMTALKLAQKAISLDDSFVPAHCLLARLYVFIRQYDKAVAQAERAVTINPNSADAYDYLGVVLVQADRAEEAIPLMKKGIRLNPIPPKNYLYHLAGAYRSTEQYEEAISVLKNVLHRDANDFLGHLFLTMSYSQLGREEEARAEAAEVLRINPKFRAERLRTMAPSKNREKVERAIDALRKAGLK